MRKEKPEWRGKQAQKSFQFYNFNGHTCVSERGDTCIYIDKIGTIPGYNWVFLALPVPGQYERERKRFFP